MNSELPGFLRIGDRVGAAFGEVAVFRQKVGSDLNSFAGAVSAFGHQAADAVADAAVFQLLVLIENVRAGIGNDHHAGFIDKAVGEGRTVRVERLGPIKAQRFRHLRNHRSGRFVLNHFTGLVLGGGDPVLRVEDAAAVVFVVADDHLTRGGCVFTDDHGRAGHGRKRQSNQGAGDGAGHQRGT